MRNMGFHWLCVAVTLVSAQPLSGQASQSDLVRQLLHGQRAEQAEAVHRAQQIGVAQLGPELRQALVTLLEGEGDLAARRRRNEITFAHPELIARVAVLVAEFGDSSTADELAGALGTAPPVADALARFGDLAAVAVLEELHTQSDIAVQQDGLIALRFLVEQRDVQPLTSGTLDRIRALTAEHLDGGRHVTLLWRAIDLAVALDDPGLRDVVQLLANDRGSLVSRGVEERDLARTQRLASDRLAGVPALPALSPR